MNTGEEEDAEVPTAWREGGGTRVEIGKEKETGKHGEYCQLWLGYEIPEG